MKSNHPLWNFFASVKLALFTLFILALTSVIGTIIPQKESPQWYIDKYGESLATLFQVLSITPDMYTSVWFLFLLGVLATNLIVCSIDRFPGVWRQIKADNLQTPIARLDKMAPQQRWHSPQSSPALAATVRSALSSHGWKTQEQTTEKSILLFAQKGAMTRTGVYIVHTSILIIFIGAIIGAFFGFKGNIMLPETRTTEKIYTSDGLFQIGLGFEIRCDRFAIEFYDNGMPKSYRSQLSILEQGKVVKEKEIVVNDPLTYKGITFYQSSFQPYQEFQVTITNKKTGQSETAIIPYQQQRSSEKSGLRFGIINSEARGESVTRVKFWFFDNHGEPSLFWLDNNGQSTVERQEGTYTVAVKQMYATGLQVAKDPGVWIVYLGCALLLSGLFIAFFMSHRRIWVLIREDKDNSSTILMTGNANKNKGGFEKTFQKLTEIVNNKQSSAA